MINNGEADGKTILLNHSQKRQENSEAGKLLQFSIQVYRNVMNLICQNNKDL
jgi:hypothetical protein